MLMFSSCRMCSSSVSLFMTLSAFQYMIVKGLSFLAFVRPVALLHRSWRSKEVGRDIQSLRVGSVEARSPALHHLGGTSVGELSALVV